MGPPQHQLVAASSGPRRLPLLGVGYSVGLLSARRPPLLPPALPPAPTEGSLHDADVFEQWQRQMVRAWDDKDYKLCSFKHILFNDLSQAGPDGMMQTPPADQLQRARAESLAAADTGLWERADAQNPNPARFLPVQMTGFTALHTAASSRYRRRATSRQSSLRPRRSYVPWRMSARLPSTCG